jgi:peroxiredoxin
VSARRTSHGSPIRRFPRRVILYALACALIIAVASGAEAKKQPSPAYTLRELVGSRASDPKEPAKTSLSAVASGRPLVVVVLKGTWCEVCLGQMSRLAAKRKELEKLGVRVVGLTAESLEKARAARKRSGLPFAILSDPTTRVTQALGLWRETLGHPMPGIVVFDNCGQERGRLRGRAPGHRPERALFELLHELHERPAGCETPNA